MKTGKRILILIEFITAALCGFFFFCEYRTAQIEIAEYAEIQDAYTSTVIGSGELSSNTTLPEAAGLPYVTADFDALLQVNPDTVGWLSIPDTVVSYPVVQAADNEKYLHTSFSGERSGAGTVFMDSTNNINPLDKNTIVYGHNMGQGREDMFGSLLYYNEKSYYDAHQWIQFDTVYGQGGRWQIFAVIHLDIRENGFDCLKQNFHDAAEFEAWIARAKELSLVDTNVPISADANILTLSTCNRADYGKSGRQLILAVKANKSL